MAIGAEPEVAVGVRTSAGGVSARRWRARALLRSGTGVVGIGIVAFWLLMALAWPLVVPYDPQALSSSTLAGPSGAHLLGTDALGRDVLSRVLAGARPVLIIAFSATAIAMICGAAVGLLTGYYRGVVDNVVMRLVDALLSFPLVIIAVLVLAVLGPAVGNVIIVIGIFFAPIVARTARSAVLVEREREYVAAARIAGDRGPYIMFVEILPNILGPLAVEATVRLAYAIFTSASLSFLTLGLQEPSPDWGLSISLGSPYLSVDEWISLAPTFALATLVIGVTLAADAVRQVIEE